MSLINLLSEVIVQGEKQYKNTLAGRFVPIEQFGHSPENILAKGDNLAFMKYLLDEKDMGGKLNLVYIDPPFYSKANYDAVVKVDSDILKNSANIKLSAYQDLWQAGLEEYLTMLTARLYFIKELLAEDGCLWVHLDWHVVHYVKIILDEIFGEKNFINEVVWNYKSGGTSKRHFSRKHDTLLFYGKTSKYFFAPQIEKSYNRGYKPYRFKGVSEYKDELGWYTMVNMKDVWQLDMVGRTAAERTGYATQKPEALLERIIESCSRPGDICADFFGGSATLAATANKMQRRWISCDAGEFAMANAHKRLCDSAAEFVLLQRTDAEGKELDCMPSVKLDIGIVGQEPGGKKVIKIELLSYNFKADNLLLDKKDEAFVRELLKKDSLRLINYWSVDFNYNGAVHRPELAFSRVKNVCEYTCERAADRMGKVNIRFVDIFGNNIIKTYDFKGECI